MRRVPWPVTWVGRALLGLGALAVLVPAAVYVSGKLLASGPDACTTRLADCLDPGTGLLRPERISGADGKARPDIPCRFVGVWSSQRGDHSFRVTLRDDGVYVMQPHSRMAPTGAYGFWAVQGTHMIWRHDKSRTGPDYNRIAEEGPGRFMLIEMDGGEARYERLRAEESTTCVP